MTLQRNCLFCPMSNGINPLMCSFASRGVEISQHYCCYCYKIKNWGRQVTGAGGHGLHWVIFTNTTAPCFLPTPKQGNRRRISGNKSKTNW